MNIAEQRARACLDKLTQYKRDGNVELGIKEFENLYSQGLDNIYVQCLDMYVELCLCTDDGEHARELNLMRVFTRIKGGNQDVQAGTEMIIDIVKKHFKTMIAVMERNVKRCVEEPSQEDLVLAALTGLPVSERAKERYFDPCQRAAETIGRNLFKNRGISLAKKTFKMYIETVLEFTKMCHALGMKDAVALMAMSAAESLQLLSVETIRASREAVEMQVSRDDFFRSESCGPAAIEALCSTLTLLAEQGSWTPAAWRVVAGLKRIADALVTNNGSVEMHSLHSQAYTRIADVLWSCRAVPYHAYCMSVAAKGQKAPELPTRAVLAALVCPDGSEAHNPFGSHHDTYSVHEDVAGLFGEPKTSRSELLASLRAAGSLAHAEDAARTLVAAFDGATAAPGTDFAALHEALTGLLAKHADLRPYEALLRQALLRRQMEVLAMTATRVDVQSLAMNSAKVSQEVYLREVEPALLQDSAVPIEIDARTNTIMFRNASRAKIISSFDKLASSLEPLPFVDPSQVTKTASGAITSSTSNSILASITIDAIFAAHRRTQLVHELQKACVEGSYSRAADREKKVQEERVRRTDERKQLEVGKREKVQKSKQQKLLVEFRELQRQERCKLVLAKLRTKYPRFKIDNAIAHKSATAFEDELTHTLAAYKRKEALGDTRDTLRGDLFERALRQIEIPKRKEMEAGNAERYKEERTAARSNYLLQHRKEFEKRQEERIVLQKFLAQAEDFEDKWRAVAGKERVSKRDEQQELLEREKRRLAGE